MDNFYKKSAKERLFVEKVIFFHFFLVKNEKMPDFHTKKAKNERVVPKKIKQNKKAEKIKNAKLSTENVGFSIKNPVNACKQKVIHKARVNFIHSFLEKRVDNPYLSTKSVER